MKRVNRIRWIFAVLAAMLLLGMTVCAEAELTEPVFGEWGDFEWFLERNGRLTIYHYGSGEMGSVFQSAWNVDAYRDEITEVIFEGDITDIGDYAFCGCSKLKRLTIPDTVTAIGSDAFSGCTALEEVTIPELVSTVGSDAFSGCTALEEVTIPDSVTSVGSGAFSDCENLTSVTLSDSVTAICSGTFSGCSSLETVTIPDSVTNIGSEAFSGCYSLETVKIPDSVTTVGEDAFYGCSLGNIYLDSLAQWFWYDHGNTSLYVDFNNGRGGKLYINGTELTSAVIPDTVKTLDAYVFCNCRSLSAVTIPDSVTSVGECAFNCCTALSTVTIPDSVTFIDDYAFGYCSGLSTVTLSAKLTSIGDDAFRYCTALGEVTLPAKLTVVGEEAFDHCGNLSAVTVPASVTSIGSNAFSGCSLTTIRVDSLEQWLSYDHTGTCLYLSSNGGAFGQLYVGGRELVYARIPDTVSAIGDYAFRYCTGLRRVTIPESVTSVGNYAFFCYDLDFVYIAGSHVAFGNSVFPGSQTKFYCRDGSDVPEWLQTNGYDCTVCPVGPALLPPDVTEIRDEAYMGTAVRYVILPDGCTAVGSRAFANCTDLVQIEIPASVTAIASDAFDGSANVLIVTSENSTAMSYAISHNIGYLIR